MSAFQNLDHRSLHFRKDPSLRKEDISDKIAQQEKRFESDPILFHHLKKSRCYIEWIKFEGFFLTNSWICFLLTFELWHLTFK